MTNRILIIGLDGATLDLIVPWAEAGHLPNIASMMKRGVHGKLCSVQPVISAAAWTTFMTGCNPGKHGVYDFVYREKDGYRLRPVTSLNITQPTLWSLLSKQNRCVGIMNVPMTYPPEEVNGFLVSGLGTPNFKSFTFPEELGDELLADGYRVNRKMYYPGNDRDGFLRDTQELIDGITNSAIKLIKNSEWDLFTVVYRDTDDVPHGFWRDMDPTHPQHDPNSPYKDAILNLYMNLDQNIGNLVAAAGSETTVIIVSDHGFGPLYKDVYLNEWLRQQGFLQTLEISSLRGSLSRIGITRDNVSKILRKLRLGKLERKIKDLIGERIELLPRVQWPDFSEGIDWSKTKAYSFGYQGQIYINLKGREPIGIVEQDAEYQELLASISDRLQDLTDPEDGKPVVDAIYTREELFHGPGIEQAPDLTLVMRDLSYITRLGYELSNYPGEVFGTSKVRENGGHRLDGVIIAAGPAIKPSNQLASSAWLGDIAPTALHILGAKIPRSMDGHVHTEWLTSELSKQKIQYFDHDQSTDANLNNALSDAEEDEVMQRLSDLGYLS